LNVKRDIRQPDQLQSVS